MADKIVRLQEAGLRAIEVEVRDNELYMALKALGTDDEGENYATYERPAGTPAGDIVILPAPAVGPPGSTEICDGRLTIPPNAIAVTAFRLP